MDAWSRQHLSGLKTHFLLHSIALGGVRSFFIFGVNTLEPVLSYWLLFLASMAKSNYTLLSIYHP